MRGKEVAVRNTESNVVPIADYAVAEIGNDGEIAAIIEENLGGENITAQDLVRVKVPAGGNTSWSLPGDGEDEESTKELTGIILFTQNQRVFWGADYDGGSAPPDCFAEDGKVGAGNPGGLCVNCPNAKFGTATNAKGEPARGQACTQKHQIFMLMQDGILPIVLNIPPTSLKNSKSYLLKLISRRKKISGVVTRLTLVKDRNNDGMEYSKVVFTNVGDVSDPDMVAAYKEAIAPFILSVASEMTQERVVEPGEQDDIGF